MSNIENKGDAIEPIKDKDSRMLSDDELSFRDSSFEEGYEESVLYSDEPEP